MTIRRKSEERSKVDATELYVSVKNGGKCYRSFNGKKSNLVFERVCLALPPGTVYGLLGPSGCGKTTLIRCILGRLGLDQGSISVFGHCPGTAESGVPGPNVGYMPQETCIPETMTIAQCWTYYGIILGMSKKKIEDAIEYFIQLLNLPPATTVNAQLSGGEMRRVAFATALIHEPKLLILDEPTVGIDCITKKKMWEHLLKLANEMNTSIILTTHYIEEARSAHKVGLMHENTLVVEDYTDNLLQNFGCDSLEIVFHKICCNFNENVDCPREVDSESTDVWIPMQRDESDKVQSLIADGELLEQAQKKRNTGSSRSFSWRDFRVRSSVLKATVIKNSIHLYRFPGALLFLMLLPSIQVCASMFSFKEVVAQTQIAVVNNDSGFLGNQYLSYLNEQIIIMKYFDSNFEALKALDNGDVHGVIVIRQNFSGAHLDRIVNSLWMNADVINSSIISVTLDNFFVHRKFIRFQLTNAYERFLYATYNESRLNPSCARPIIYFEKEIIDHISVPRNLLMSISMLSIGSFCAPIAVAVLTFFVEIYHGHLERSVVAGVTLAETVLGLFVTLNICYIFQLLLISAGAFFSSFQAPTWGSFFLILFILYLHGLSGMAIGMFLPAVFSQIQLMLIIAGNLTMFLGAISGGFWPLVTVPWFARGIFLALPTTYQVRAIAAVYLGTSFYVSELLCSMAVSLTHTILFITFTMIFLKIKT